jgi:glycogen phosphorylase
MTASINPDLPRGYLPVDSQALRKDYIDKLFCQQGKFLAVATLNDHYLALAGVVRDRLLARWIQSAQTFFEQQSRTVAYLSAEFLLGPQLGNNLLCLGIRDAVSAALQGMPYTLDELVAYEEEPGLGNGGLGRLAACYMDSLATLNIPAIGYGLRYEYGIFDQLCCTRSRCLCAYAADSCRACAARSSLRAKLRRATPWQSS